ncbi:MAG: phenylalanine--tRNA ligase beta subunit-related protein [Actinomycetota bacterium]|nr:phenylalanine--tRNA ligase beta subunit-related protein [Actinomycetota bacterium]
MELVHEPSIAERFPDHLTAAVRIRGEGGLEPTPGAVAELRERLGSPEAIEPARRAAEYWAGVFRAMGAKPRHRSSIDALVQRFDQLGSQELAVDLPPSVAYYNLLSLAFGVPMGGYATARIAGQVLRLTVPGKGRPFTPLGRPREVERTRGGEVAYLDEEKVVCRYWNLIDCDQTKLVGGEDDVLFVFDLVEDLLEGDALAFLGRVKSQVQAAFGDHRVSSGLCGARAASAAL